MSKITADLIYYNANPSNSYVGDCVIRSISLALGMPYETVRAELNKLKRTLGAPVYNIGRVYNRYLKEHGVLGPFNISADRISAAQFCELHPTGTFLLLTDSRKTPQKDPSVSIRSDHICCVVDGNLYDSWKSDNSLVEGYYNVPETPKIQSELVDLNELWAYIDPKLSDYLTALAAKSTEVSVYFSVRKVIIKSKYTLEVTLRAQLDPDSIDPKSAYANTYFSAIAHTFVVKISPLTTTDDFERLFKQLKQKIYDWWYIVYKDIKDEKAAHSFTAHPKFRGDKTKLMNLPEWVRPRSYIIEITEILRGRIDLRYT